MSSSIRVIYARGLRGEFGCQGGLPWKDVVLQHDMDSFRSFTRGHTVIMGRHTFASLKFKPLSNRFNIVIGHPSSAVRSYGNSSLIAESPLNCIEWESTLEGAIKTARRVHPQGKIWVIGGTRLILDAMTHPECTEVVITNVLRMFSDCDVTIDLGEEANCLEASEFYLSSHSDVFHTEHGNETYPYQIHVYRKTQWEPDTSSRTFVSRSPIPILSRSPSPPLRSSDLPVHPEQQYLDLLRDVLQNGSVKGDRTGTGTRSLFGKVMTFDLSNGEFPVLTTKRVFWRGIVEELLWFISGSTDTTVLSKKKVHIWDANTSRETLDKNGLTHYAVGTLGPGYGFQWRHAGAEYVDAQTDYTGQGVDQLQNVIDKLRTDRNDRRILIQSWNVKDLPKMSLVPCHVLVQFYVDAESRLSSCMYQRSADLFLGVPFNISQYCLLTCMIAQVCNLKLGTFTHILGDAHIYNTHVDAVAEQLSRTPVAFPTLKLDPTVRNIDDFRMEHIELVGYNPLSGISAPMSV